MAEISSGGYSYDVIESWAKVPAGWSFGLVTGVAVDSKDRVYICHQKEEPPLMVFDREGNYLSSWGSDFMVEAHHMYIDAQDHIYLADRGSHEVSKLTLDGRHLIDMGHRGQPSDTGCYEDGGEVLRAAGPFNRPTHLTPSPSGDMYASDGYRNCRVHRFSANGDLISSWGTPVPGVQGGLHGPHSVWVDRQGLVYVCDRYNNRIQIFSPTGDYVSEWPNLNDPTDMFVVDDRTAYVYEGGPYPPDNYVTVRDMSGNIQAQWDTPPAHSLWVDTHGDIYLTIVTQKRVMKYIRKG